MNYFTKVTLNFLEGKHNYRLIFGTPEKVHTMKEQPGHTSKVAYFKTGAIFCLDIWQSTNYGRTSKWKTYVLEASEPGKVITSVPLVEPGANVLIEVSGARRCKFLLKWILILQNNGNPAELSKEYFQSRDLILQSIKPEKNNLTALN